MKDFKGKNIYVGIDVHKNSCELKVSTDNLLLGNTIRLSPVSGEKISKYLKKNFKNGNYHCVYEAGFSGFWLYRQLVSFGINCIVVNPADVPISHKDKVIKNDKIDCIKLSKGLRSGMLSGIYIPAEIAVNDRSLVRQRYSISKNLAQLRSQIKSHLNFIGVELIFTNKPYSWSAVYVNKLYENAVSRNDLALIGYIETMKTLRQQKLLATRRIRKLSKEERHKGVLAQLIKIRGIGVVTAMIIKTELVEINRFDSFDKLQSYVGFIPGQRASGESDRKSGMTKRANKHLRQTLVLAAWSSVRYDPEMSAYYEEQKKSLRKAQLSIIKVCRKLLRKIKYNWEIAV